MTSRLNLDVADQLEEAARLLAEQGANPFRVRAYQRGALSLRRLGVSVSDLFAARGLEGLREIPGIGETLARAIRDVIKQGRLPMLDRLRGEADPVRILSSVPGIGPRIADRLYHELGIGTLEDLETAAHDGRLEEIAGFGDKRLAGIRDSLAHRLSRSRPWAPVDPAARPSVTELLDVDREYREKAATKSLPLIAPRRFNPDGKRWLPILHASRGPRHYTALFSNTARAHRLNRTHDWVVIYVDGDHGETQATVVTATRGPLAGRRIVRGREAECEALQPNLGPASAGRPGPDRTSPGEPPTVPVGRDRPAA